jgi:hypothetical protein
VHESIEKADGVVFRCTLSGSEADRGLEIPAWMFDRTVCADQPPLMEVPFVSMGALASLSRFACNSRDWQQLIEMCCVRAHARLCFHRHRPTKIIG